MKLVKSLLLGSAAGLAATVGAQAADLPFRKAAPVEYVRVCDWTGAGYFYIPGSDTCLGLSGFVRAEYAFVNATRTFTPTPSALGAAGATGISYSARAKSTTGFFVRGQINFDARTQTAYGLLRSYFRIQADRSSGNYNAIAGTPTSGAYVDKGYITFAGFTAGRIQSFFDLYADNYNFDGIANSDESAQVLAYTATFGGGFSATISVEDPNGSRRDGIGNVFAGAVAGGAIGAGPGAGYGGFRYPDAVLQVRDDQAWGAIQLSAAYHDINTITSTVAAGPRNDQSGFAVQAGVDIKLPMLAAGDELFIQGAYQSGAYLYQDSGSGLNGGFYGNNIGGFVHNDVDAVAIANGAGGYTLSQGHGFSVLAAIHHYFTPQFHDVLYGSYEEISYGAAKNYDWTVGGLGDGSEFRVGNQFLFTPVHNMTIGLDVMYAKINQTLAHAPGVAPTAVPFGVKINPDSFQARLRLERDF